MPDFGHMTPIQHVMAVLDLCLPVLRLVPPLLTERWERPHGIKHLDIFPAGYTLVRSRCLVCVCVCVKLQIARMSKQSKLAE
jgi:hypothetical protein